VIAQYSPGVFEPISNYMVENVSKAVGVKAIVTMYNSQWVRENPSVHGFVFEWDIFVRVQSENFLELSDAKEQKIFWHVDKPVCLKREKEF
jgi:hypothetical protein